MQCARPCKMDEADEIFEPGAVLVTADGTVLVTEEGTRVGLAPLAAPPEAAPPVDPSIGISATHRIGTGSEWQAPLAAVLEELQLHRMRALLEKHSVSSGEWFAEHARMQLAPGMSASSRPLWLAWMGTALGEVFVMFWAADERAARRGVLELGLGRAARATHVLLPHTLLRQLRRCAYESEELELLERACPAKACDAASDVSDGGVERMTEAQAEPWPASWAVLPAPLHPAAEPSDECDGLIWATLLERRGEALAQLRERRAQAASLDESAARAKQEEVMRQLRAKDPGAEVDVTHESEGKYKLNKISFNGHLFVCPVIVNKYSDVTDIVRTATYKCLCC